MRKKKTAHAPLPKDGRNAPPLDIEIEGQSPSKARRRIESAPEPREPKRGGPARWGARRPGWYGGTGGWQEGALSRAAARGR